MRQIEISKRLHSIKKVILINHTDCGAYEGDDSKHEIDLRAAKNLVLKTYPDLEVSTLLAKIDSGEVTFEDTK